MPLSHLCVAALLLSCEYVAAFVAGPAGARPVVHHLRAAAPAAALKLPSNLKMPAFLSKSEEGEEEEEEVAEGVEEEFEFEEPVAAVSDQPPSIVELVGGAVTTLGSLAFTKVQLGAVRQYRKARAASESALAAAQAAPGKAAASAQKAAKAAPFVAKAAAQIAAEDASAKVASASAKTQAQLSATKDALVDAPRYYGEQVQQAVGEAVAVPERLIQQVAGEVKGKLEDAQSTADSLVADAQAKAQGARER